MARTFAVAMIFHWLRVSVFCCSRRWSMACLSAGRRERSRPTELFLLFSHWRLGRSSLLGPANERQGLCSSTMRPLSNLMTAGCAGTRNRRLRGYERPFCRLERHHPHPEHGFVADVDIVLAHETQFAVGPDAQHREASRYGLYRIAVPHIDRQIMFGDQPLSSLVCGSLARLDPLRLDMLDRGRFAGVVIDR